MRILCTGGAGYVGSATLRWLLQHGYEAMAYDDLSAGNRAAVPDGRLVVGDILDRDRLSEVMHEYRIEGVIHFAAVASVPESVKDPELYWRINVLGTKNVLDAMRACNVKRIIFSSTAATYGFEGEMPLVESSPQLPQVPYGSTKLAGEWIIKEYAAAYDMGYAFLRYFNASGADPDGAYGEDRPAESHLIPLVLKTALGQREKLYVYGGDFDTRDGSCVRDYVHTADLAQAHQLAIEFVQPGIGRAYNLGSGVGTTVLEVIKACEKVTGKTIPYEITAPRPGDPPVLIASPQAIMKELGWNPRYSEIETIVSTAWEWHRGYPEGYGERQ